MEVEHASLNGVGTRTLLTSGITKIIAFRTQLNAMLVKITMKPWLFYLGCASIHPNFADCF